MHEALVDSDFEHWYSRCQPLGCCLGKTFKEEAELWGLHSMDPIGENGLFPIDGTVSEPWE